MGAKVFFAGLPTEMDVRTLFEKFGVPKEGESIGYAAVSDAIQTPIGSARFRTITTAWRNRIRREYNVYVQARDGAFSARTPSDRISHASAKFRTAGRAMNFGTREAELTDPSRLSEVERAHREHLTVVGGALRSHAILAARRKQPMLPAPVGN